MKTYEQIMLELQKRQYAPVYFLAGEEPYFIDKVAAKIEREVLDETAASFDRQVLYGRDLAEIGPVISMARQFPMMGDRSVIIVREAQDVKKWENFELYWQNPMPSTVLVVCYKGKPNGNMKAFKGLKDTDYFMESGKLRDYQIGKWILSLIQEKQLQVEPKVVQILADSLGTDMGRIEKELEKLTSGLPEGTQVIDAAMVERNIGISKDFNAFELQRALIDGDLVKANRIVNYFAANPKDHAIQKELRPLFDFFTNLLIYLYLPDRSERAAAAVLRISPYFVRDYQAAARRFTKMKAFKAIGYIREADARSKGIDCAATSDGDIWKELIYKIMH
ncbi:MAG: DNA polymerase III subunit delta [Paludibacteraceae bacterium]|nr:DNA polymerase III subunit delta [Paludibacteraceae bacterium]